MRSHRWATRCVDNMTFQIPSTAQNHLRLAFLPGAEHHSLSDRFDILRMVHHQLNTARCYGADFERPIRPCDPWFARLGGAGARFSRWCECKRPMADRWNRPRQHPELATP